MIQCSKCKNDIPDDSWYCDQCGERLMFCPKCNDGKPRRGKRCTQCGSVLVPGDESAKVPAADTPRPDTTPQDPQPKRSGTVRATPAPHIKPDEPSRLVMINDPAKIAILKANAIIGRTTGDYVDVFGSCGYVSGQHGKITLHSSGIWLYCDLGSTNGSKLNNTTLEPNKHYHLKKGMTLEIGTLKFRVE